MSALPREREARAALRRGWCPSTLKPMETGDGWLVRLHPPGGMFAPSQLVRIAALAREHGNGLIEISARGNMQLRGVSAQTHPALVAALLDERLVDEHDGDGPQRLTLISPLALAPPPACGGEGRDGGESDLTSPAAGSLDQAAAKLSRPPTPNPSPPQAGGGGLRSDLIDAVALADAIEARGRLVAGLPAKICVIVDGGGAIALDGFAADLRVLSVAAGQVAIGLPDGQWRGSLAIEDAPAMIETILRGFAGHHAQAPDRVRRLRDLPPEILASLCDLPAIDTPYPRPTPPRAGLFAHGDGRFAAIAALPFGCCGAAVLDALGCAAARCGAVALRLSPWRGLACLDLTEASARAWLVEAQDLGLIVDDRDPRLSVQACAGKPACLRAESETMADAARLAEAASTLLADGVSLHVSGCVKSCANPGIADLTLIGREGRYDVVLHGTTHDKAIATLDLSEILRRLQPGQDLFARLTTAGRKAEPAA